MPVVPISVAKRALRSGPNGPNVPKGPNGQTQPPSEPWALMAAAQMHSEGRLIDKGGLEEPGESQQWSGSAEDKQRAMNLLSRKQKGQDITKDSSKWLDDYMKWTDRTSKPVAEPNGQ